MDTSTIKIWIAEGDKEVDRLYEYEDDIEKYIVGKRDEWIGWLRHQMKTNPMFTVMYIEVEGELKGYCIATKALAYPVSNSIYIFYAHSKLGIEGSKYVWGEICDWARKLGAAQIEMKTNQPEFFIRNYSFEVDEFTSLTLRL